MALLRRRRKSPAASQFGAGWNVPVQFNFTRDVVETLASDPTRSALTFVDAEGIVDRRTFDDLAKDAARWAHLLRTRIDRGDRAMFVLGRTPAWHGAMLGALKSGVVAVPCADMLRARDLAFRVRDSGARLVVADRHCEVEIEEMRNQIGDSVPVVYVDEAAAELGRYMPVARTEETHALETAFILYTSGTTKEPRGVVHTHAYTWAKRMQASHWLGAHERDVVWCTAGTGWAKAIWNVLLGPWSQGAELVVHQGPFDPEERLALVQRLGVTVLCQAPTEYRLLAKLDSLETAYVPRLRHLVSAGEPLNPEVISVFQEALGLTVHDGYGQTENSLLVANAAGAPVRPGSMGTPTPGHEVAVIDEAGNVCPPGVEGDIALLGRPPTLFQGYWNDRERTDAVFRDGWYVTGDRAVRDEEGYLWFVGRADDVILSAAYRIGPFEVESALLEHPAVAESAVVGAPDPDRGQVVKAFVVLREGHDPSEELAGELQEHVKSVTAPYKYPRVVAFVAELPKTASGKIRRNELRDPDSPLVADAITVPAVPTQTEAAVPDAVAIDELAARRDRERAERHAAAQREAEAHERARAEADEAARARLAALEAAHREAQEIAQLEAEEMARLEAEEAARLVADAAARRQAAELERHEIEEAEAARQSVDVEAAEAARRAEDAERQRAEAEAAERQRIEAEETARREAEEAERRRAEAEAAERQRAEAEAAERARREAEEAARREAEEAERQRAAAEAAEREWVEAEAAERRRIEAEEAARREAEEAARREAEEAERRRAQAEAAARREAEEAARREAEEAERRRAEAEAAARQEAEEAARREAAEAERARAAAAEAARLEEEAAARRAAEEADRRRLEAEEAARVQTEEAARLESEAAAQSEAEAEELELGAAEATEVVRGASRWEERRRRREEAALAKAVAEEERREAKRRAEEERQREISERAAAKLREEEERRAQREAAQSARRGGLGWRRKQREDEFDAPDEPVEPITDIVERLRRYSGDIAYGTTIEEHERETGTSLSEPEQDDEQQHQR